MNKRPVGVFDSGVGGISVLRELVKIMPHEDYIYFGDSRNAPYGSKTSEEVRELSLSIAGYLIELGVKAIVVACNTATSASVRKLREMYPELVVVGIEPAVKPAALSKDGAKVLVLATPVTLREVKFRQLASLYEDRADIYSVPMHELAAMIERDEKREVIKEYIKKELEPHLEMKPDAIVLGCTHYPFVRDIIQEVAGEKIKIFDGGEGVARETRRRIAEKNALNDSGGSIRYICSDGTDKLDMFAKKYL